MSGARKNLDPVRERLKIATHRSVKLAGGLDAFAEVTRVGRKTIHDYSNTGNERHQDTFMPVDVFADLIQDMKERGEVPPLLVALCDLAGVSCVRVPEPDRDTPAQGLELTAVNKRLWSFSDLVSRHLQGQHDDAEFQAEAAPLILAILNDFQTLKQQALTVRGGDE